MAFRKLEQSTATRATGFRRLATAPSDSDGAVKPQEGTLSKMGKGVYKYSGAKSYMDWVFLPSKVLETKIEIETAKGLSESRKGLADLTTKLVKQWRAEKNPTRKEKLQGIISDNFKQMGIVFEQEKESESRMLTQKQVAGTTLKAGATVALLGKHPTWGTRAIGSGLIGATHGAGTALQQDKSEAEIVKQAVKTGSTAAVLSIGFDLVLGGLVKGAKITDEKITDKALTLSAETAKYGFMKELKLMFGADMLKPLLKADEADKMIGTVGLLVLTGGGGSIVGVVKALMGKKVLQLIASNQRVRIAFGGGAMKIAKILQSVPNSQKEQVGRAMLQLLAKYIGDTYTEE